MSKIKVEYVPTDRLKTYVNNAKVHTAEQVEQIKKSIIEFGFNDPIAVWKDNEIIEGHGRLMAALELGIEELPIIRLDYLTDEQRRAYTLVHNQLTINTGFEIEVLNDELESITEFSMEDFGLVPSVSNLKALAEETGDVEEELKKVICPRCGKVVAIKRR